MLEHVKKKKTWANFSKKWITDLNVKCKTIKFQEITGENDTDFGYGGDVSDIIPKAQSIKEIIHKLNFFKSKLVCPMKGERVRRQAAERENICIRHIW